MKHKNLSRLLALCLALFLVLSPAAVAAQPVTQPYMTWLTRTYQPGYYRPLPGGNMRVFTMDGYYGIASRTDLDSLPTQRFVQWIDVSPTLAVVSQGDKWGGPAAYGVVLKSSGALVIPCIYASFSSTDRTRLLLSTGIAGIAVDLRTGAMLGDLTEADFYAVPWGEYLPPDQDGGLLPMVQDGKHGYYSPSGGILVPPLYDSLSVVGQKDQYFLAQKGQNYGVFDRTGKVVFPFLFPNVFFSPDNGDIYAIHGGFLGVAHQADYLVWSQYAGETVAMGPAAGHETVPPVENPILCDGQPAKLSAYLFEDSQGGGANYVKLRDVAALLTQKSCQFSVDWAAETGIALRHGAVYAPVGGELTPLPQGEQPYSFSAAPLTIDGTAVVLNSYVIAQNTYFKLRDLGDALGFTVGWTAQEGVTITTP